MPPSIMDIIPSDILRAIFVHCVYRARNFFDGREGATFPTIWAHEAPLLLLRVCRDWRDITLSTPALWDSVSIDCPYNIERIVPNLDRWLSRAGSRLLSIEICYKVHPDTSSDGILSLFNRHATQVRELSLNIAPYDYCRFREAVGPLPNLAKLMLYTLRHPMYDAHPIEAFSDAAALRDVHIRAGFNPQNMLLPWGQLTTLKVDNMHACHCLEVLSLASNLVECNMTVWPSGLSDSIFVPPLVQLRKLVLNTMGLGLEDDSIVSKLLARITAPALLHLEFGENPIFEIWSSFIVRSDLGSVLQRLAIEPTRWTSRDYKRFLGSLVSLKELKLRRPGLAFYAILAPLQESLEFLPQLRRFEEDGNYIDWDTRSLKGKASLATVLDMLESRIGQLQKFKLFTTTGLVGSTEMLGRLDALKKGGMKIFIDGSKKWDAL